MQGQGGYGISRFDGAQTIDAEHFYWQRYQAGKACSVLFVACHQQIRILGFNQMWNCSHKPQAFVFAGIKNYPVISEQNQLLLAQWLQDLLQIYPLQGLASLDFIVNDGVCYLLEINARIPASAQLYGKSVLNLHLQACLGELPDWGFSHAPAGYQIVFADQPMRISSGLQWPDWVVDRPEAGAFIGKGQPVCSIIADGNDADEVEDQLQRQEKVIENLLNTGLYHHAIPGKRQ
jgi:predicted ATP-grasp superfamily ATP-dependent carboligase